MKQTLGEQETRFFAYVQLRKLRVVRLGDLKPLALSRIQEGRLLSRLSRGKLIARVRQGLYLVPSRLPMGGAWSPDEALALNTLLEDRQGRYQICGPNAFTRYGYDEQVPTQVYAYNNRLSGERKIGAVKLNLIKVADSRLGSIELAENPEGNIAVYASRERTLLDAVYDWSRFNTLPRAYGWIRRDLTDRKVTAKQLIDVTIRYGDVGTVRRMGALLERLGVASRELNGLARLLPPSTAYISLIPTLPKRGSLNRRWGVVINGEV